MDGSTLRLIEAGLVSFAHNTSLRPKVRRTASCPVGAALSLAAALCAGCLTSVEPLDSLPPSTNNEDAGGDDAADAPHQMRGHEPEAQDALARLAAAQLATLERCAHIHGWDFPFLLEAEPALATGVPPGAAPSGLDDWQRDGWEASAVTVSQALRMFVPGTVVASLRAEAALDTIDVDVAAIDACLDRLPTTACEEALQIGEPTCPGVFVGLTPAGGACTIDDECPARLFCIHDEGFGGAGICGASGPYDPTIGGGRDIAQVGDPCETVDTGGGWATYPHGGLGMCGHFWGGLACVAGSCVPNHVARIGETCAQPGDLAYGSGACVDQLAGLTLCVDDDNDGIGICTAR